jgi:hypothetical protein
MKLENILKKSTLLLRKKVKIINNSIKCRNKCQQTELIGDENSTSMFLFSNSLNLRIGLVSKNHYGKHMASNTPAY